MRLPRQLPLASWLAIVVATVGVISHLFDQSHDITLIVLLVSACLLAFDWLTTPGD
jgi:hypothetical protein